MQTTAPSCPRIRLVDWIWPLLACWAGWQFILEGFNAPILHDAQYTYLPAARAVLKQGWGFFLTPESYRVVPLGYLWPAVWNADPAWIRSANMGLWAGCVVFLWRTSWLLGGPRAAAISVVLLLANQELQRYFPSEMTEPIFLFGAFGLAHALARMVIECDNSASAVAEGAVMLTVTLLSRPVLQLVAPAAFFAIVALLVRAPMWLTNSARATLSSVARSLAWGLTVPMALVVKNGLMFGLWGLGTGSGVGLYLGTHPLTKGAEPSFLGFDFDVNAVIAMVALAHDTLSLAGDRAARNAALWSLQSMSAADAIVYFSQKLWWWLAHHPVELQKWGAIQRKIRLLEMTAIVVALGWVLVGWRAKRSQGSAPNSHAGALLATTSSRHLAFALVLMTVLSLMVVQLLPILYNSRYSTTLLDPWLIPLAGFGLAYVSSPVTIRCSVIRRGWFVGLKASPRASVATAVCSVFGIAALAALTYDIARKREYVAIDIQRVGAIETLWAASDPLQTLTTGMVPVGDRTWSTTEFPAALIISFSQNDVDKISKLPPFQGLWDTVLTVKSTLDQRCGTAEFSYQTATGAILQPGFRYPLQLRLKNDDKPQNLTVHANLEMRPKEPGGLRIVLHCPIGTQVQWTQSRLLASRYAMEAANHAKLPH